MGDYFKNKRVALLGGASMIGVHIAEALMYHDAEIWIADDLSAGRRSNIAHLIQAGIGFMELDLRDYANAKCATENMDIVFHLAAQHGGRGFVGTHNVELYDNLDLDTTICRACADNKVEKVIFSSSACAYPIHVQQNPDELLYLSEDLIDYKNMQQADGAYGTEKLVGELILDAYIGAGAFKGCSTRSFAVYGKLIRESHAIAALIAKTMIKQQPFEIWGDGQQIRNWTYAEDNAHAALLAAEYLVRGPINIGIEERLTPMDACEIIWNYVGWHPSEIKFMPDKPTGPLNRTSKSDKLKALGWKPRYSFKEGIHKTVDWYYNTHDADDVEATLHRRLTAK